MRRKLWSGQTGRMPAVLLALFMAAGLAQAAGTDAGGQQTPVWEEEALTAGEAAGAWRTAEDGLGFITLILYPDDAFRLYQYQLESGETLMLEGVRTAEGSVIVVTGIRLGRLDSDGHYTQTGEMDIARYEFSLVPGEPAAIRLTDEQGVSITLFPVEPDSPE